MASTEQWEHACSVCKANSAQPKRIERCWGLYCYHYAMHRIREKQAYINVHGEPQTLWVENYWLDRSTTGRE